MNGKSFEFEPHVVPHVETKYRKICTPIPVPESQDVIERLRNNETISMTGQPLVVWDHAEGANVYDAYGNKWIDFSSSILISNAGHGNPEICDAIRWHTTGKPDMSLLEKIIFVADYIEPGRFTAKNLPLIRKMAFSDIDEALLKILYDTLVYLNSTGNAVDPMTQKTYEYYKRLDEEKNIYD